MSRIKDFFYNKNDLIVVLIILALAAGIIWLRVGNIMAYPETLDTTVTEATQSTKATSESKSTTQETTQSDNHSKNTSEE